MYVARFMRKDEKEIDPSEHGKFRNLFTYEGYNNLKYRRSQAIDAYFNLSSKDGKFTQQVKSKIEFPDGEIRHMNLPSIFKDESEKRSFFEAYLQDFIDSNDVENYSVEIIMPHQITDYASIHDYELTRMYDVNSGSWFKTSGWLKMNFDYKFLKPQLNKFDFDYEIFNNNLIKASHDPEIPVPDIDHMSIHEFMEKRILEEVKGLEPFTSDL